MNKILIFFGLALISFSAQATHNRGGEILYKRIAPFTSGVGSATVQVYTYSITVIKYMDHGVNVADRCMDTVYFGDGQNGIAPRINGISSFTCNCASLPCGEIITSSSGYTVKKSVYTIIHTYAGPGSYLIKSIDPNRTGGVRNIPNSVNIPFYIEAQMYINASMGMNSSPVFSNPPTDRLIIGTCGEISGCAYDEDGDSLSYELSTCKDETGQTAPGYFAPSLEGGTYSINPTSGLLSWCNPNFLDGYNLAFIVKEWRKTSCNGTYQLLGYIFRDFQVLVVPSTSKIFSITTMSDICIKAGNNAVTSFIVNSNGLSAEVLGETKSASTSSAQINPNFLNGTTTVTYNWIISCSEARKKPYDVYLVFNSSGASSPPKFYRQFKVTVLPPSPLILSTIIDTGKVTLNWNICMTNAAGYNIYRKTGSNNWVPGACEQGVSAASGFILVGVAPPTATSFTDTNVWPILNGTTAHYIVTAFTQDCAESVADNAQTVTLVVGINENNLSEGLKIFPNPFHDIFEINLETRQSKPIEINLLGVDGKVLSCDYKNIALGKWEISTKNLPAGIYLLQIKTESGFITKKIVKE
jgi:hypothetical protein